MTHGITPPPAEYRSPSAAPRRPLPPEGEDLALVALLQRLSRVLGGVAAPLRRHLALIAGTAMAAGALGIALSYLVPVEYRSDATFFVDRAGRGALPSGLASLGRSLGLGAEDDAQPPDFYGWLATSDDVLNVVLRDTVPAAVRVPGRPGPTAWAQLFDKPIPADTIAWNKGLALFKKKVNASANLSIGTITISAPGPTRELAMWTSGRVFASMNGINTTRRRTRAGNELRFLQGRRDEAEVALRGAEGRLTGFLNANRQAVLPPNLRFEEDRLRRQVDVARDAFIGITRSAQEAELRAVRDVPALSLIEGPTYPVRKSKPRRLVMGIVAGLLGFVAAYALAWWRIAVGPGDDRA